MTVAHYLGLTPKSVDGTAVGGCSFMIHVRHAAAAIASGLCETVLITHGESGRSGVGRTRNAVAPASLAGQFEQPYGPVRPLRGRAHPQCRRADEPRGSVRAALRALGAADFVHNPGLALHDFLRRPRESGGPGASDEAPEPWVPAFAGTTK